MKREGHVWSGADLMQHLIDARDSQYSVGFVVLATHVDDGDRASRQKAIDGLIAAFNGMDENQAKDLLKRLVGAGLAIEDDQSLVPPGWGTRLVPNQKHNAPVPEGALSWQTDPQLRTSLRAGSPGSASGF